MADEEQKPKHPAAAPKPNEATPAVGEASATPGDGPALTPEEVEQAALLQSSLTHPFGPAFFLTQLRGFVGEKWPGSEARPVVEIHLGDGDVLDLCHIIGVSPHWAVLAVADGEEGESRRVRTEFVPFEGIARVTMRASRPDSPHLGFEANRVPRILGHHERPEMTPEESIRAAAAGTREPRGDAA